MNSIGKSLIWILPFHCQKNALKLGLPVLLPKILWMWVLPFFCQKLLWNSMLLLLSYTNQLLIIPWVVFLLFVSLALIPHLLLITILQQNVILNVGLTIMLPKKTYKYWSYYTSYCPKRHWMWVLLFYSQKRF